MTRQEFEQTFFRSLNGVLEPAIRKGLLSPSCLPVGLISLQSQGFKSGLSRRTPLFANALGPYALVSTVRGDRSFWIKNLIKTPQVRYHRGGKVRASTAVVIRRGQQLNRPEHLPSLLGRGADLLAKYLPEGFAVALLLPEA